MGLVSADGTPAKATGPIPCLWAVVVGVDEDGAVYLVDHSNAQFVRSQRQASLDDIYAAAYIGGKENPDDWEFSAPDEPFVTAFVAFQISNGTILASPDVFENLTPVIGPTGTQVCGAFGVLMAQITAQKTADVVVLTLAAANKPKSSLVTV